MLSIILSLCVLFFPYVTILPVAVEYKIDRADKNSLQVTLHFKLDPGEVLFKDSLSLVTDTSDIRLSQWTTHNTTKQYYDASMQETKNVWQDAVTLMLFAIKENNDIKSNPYLNLFYQTNLQKTVTHETIKLPFKDKTMSAISSSASLGSNSSAFKKPDPSSTPSWSARLTCYYQNIEDIIKQNSSIPVRLILAILLGILLSLTPCIYPMIPITVGILQAQKRTSIWYNFLLALSYTFGLSTTFAILGLLVSYTGPLYGKLLSQPLFVLILAGFLIYLALTMLGVCELYIPRFAKSSTLTSTRGSLLSGFMFGIVSGTFASPCVSPGLILLLSIVATMNNIILGFLLLFCFGIGLSMPLLIVGTFSTSLDLLPKAGIWMIEIKKFFGVLLLGAALYYLNNIVNICTILGLLAIVLFSLGLFYARSAQKSFSSGIKRFENICALLFIASAIVVGVQTYILAYCSAAGTSTHIVWLNSFDEALTQARKEEKLLFVDVWADYCSMCKRIDAFLFHHQLIKEKLPILVTPLKINGSSGQDQDYLSIKKRYNIVGLPAFLLINPQSLEVVKQWSSDLYYMKPEDFIDEIERSYCKILPNKT